MNILIPMAGHSRRFQRAGYCTPKAFTLVDNRPMIHWIVGMFSPTDRFIFVALRQHMANSKYKEILQTAAPRYHIIEIDAHELGPVYSALLADDLIKDNEPIIITYCDFYQHWNYEQFLMQMQGYEGGMAVFRGFHPASFGNTFYAYVRANASLEMLELREKQSFTNKRHEEYASTGVYYVESWDLYKQYARRLLQHEINIGNEYYVSLIYNPMVADGLRVRLFEVDKFICWGTPEDLDQYLFWSDFFADDVPRLKERSL